MKLPKTLHNLFWDVNIQSLNEYTHKEFIIQRILEKGDFTAISWILKYYSRDTISQIVTSRTNLSSATVNFWKQLLTT